MARTSGNAGNWHWILPAICLLILSFPSVSRGATIRVVEHKETTHLYLADVASYYGLKYTVSGKKIFLTSRATVIGFTEDNRLMTLNGIQMYLSRPIACVRKIHLIGKSDFDLLLEPLMRKSAVPKHPLKVIVVDAGHGGKDVGAIAGGVMEKTINLQVATRLAEKLAKKGFKVHMTRNSDVDCSLEKRAEFAEKCKADLFVSVHCNAAASNVNGLEVFVATAAGDYGTGETTPQKVACAANAFNSLNTVLAYAMQSSLLSTMKMTDRGIRHKRFYVIRNVSCPAILVEIGFITNASDRRKMLNAAYQDALAGAMADSIVLFRNVTK